MSLTPTWAGIRLGEPALILAPMEGVTDAPMREWFARRGGFTHAVSEFLRVTQNVPPPHVFWNHIPELKNQSRTASGLRVQVQLLGGDAEKLAESAARAVELGACGVDLNFGCPAPVVNRHDGGAALLQYPHRLREIVRQVRAAVPHSVPVSAKMRLGFHSTAGLFDNVEALASGGVSWLTIHGRTKLQGYQPPVFWGPIGEIKKRYPQLPIVANGDIWTLSDFERCRDETGCEHFMLGRGAMADPHLPLQIAHALGLPGGQSVDATSLEYGEWLRRFEEFSQLMMSISPTHPRQLLNRMKQWARMAHLRRSLPWFDSFKRFETWDEMRVG